MTGWRSGDGRVMLDYPRPTDPDQRVGVEWGNAVVLVEGVPAQGTRVFARQGTAECWACQTFALGDALAWPSLSMRPLPIRD